MKLTHFLKVGLLFICLTAWTKSYAQIEKQSDTTARLQLPFISVDRLKLLNNVDVIANMQFNQFNRFVDGKYAQSNFAMNQFRLELKGNITENIYFRFRDRYTRLPEPQDNDVISRSVDMSFIRLDVSPKWNFQFGKMGADWGGYEFDLNPIEIYEYNDLIENSDNFLSGVQAQYISSTKHAFTFQVLNSRTRSYKEIYDTIPGVQESRFPVALVGNWRGNLFGGRFTTLWSYSIFQEAKNRVMNYIALGNKLNLNKATLIYDFKWSDQDIDRTEIITNLISNEANPFAAQGVRYVEHWIEFRYQFAPRWKFQTVLMSSDAYWFDNPDDGANPLLRTSYGINPTVEFYPYGNFNLRFFATFVHRIYNHSPYAENRFGSVDFTTSRISFGFISPLLIL